MALHPGTEHWKVSTFLTKLNDAPDIGCDAEVLQYIETVRPPVYWFPCLRTGQVRPCPQNPGHSKSEWERRNVERTLMGQISRYYRRPGDVLGIADREEKKRWMRPLLLKEGKHGCDHSPHHRHFAYLCSFQS